MLPLLHRVLDLYIKEPNGNVIYFGNKGTRFKGNLNVDANLNITFPIPILSKLHVTILFFLYDVIYIITIYK